MSTYLPILKETSPGSIHKHSFSGKLAFTSWRPSPLSFAAELSTGSKLSVIRRHRYPLPFEGFSGYQWPSNFFVNRLTTSSPKSCTRLLGSLFTRYPIKKFTATLSSTSIRLSTAGWRKKKFKKIVLLPLAFGEWKWSSNKKRDEVNLLRDVSLLVNIASDWSLRKTPTSLATNNNKEFLQ